MTEPKIILWDIETTHNLVAVFKLFGEDYIPHDNILQERYIVCAAWKELGKGKPIRAVSILDDPKRFKKNPNDDYHVVKTLHAMLSDADVIVAHNGDRYDIKFAEARMLFHGLPPLPPIMKIDTLKEAKNRFLFNSNRLDYLAKFLGGKGKKNTPKGLWLHVLAHDVAAIKEMVAYNKQDITELEFVFNKLAPYMATHVNRHLFGGEGCPRCGSTDVQARGLHKSLTQTYQRYCCNGCRGWFREVKRSHGARTRVL